MGGATVTQGFLESLAMWLTMALLAGATVLYSYHFLSKRAKYSFYATLLTGAGFLCLTASVGLHSSVAEGSRLWGPYSMVLAAWALVLVYFAVEHLIKLKVYGTVLVPVALALLVVAQLMGAGASATAPPPVEAALLESWRVTVHVILIVFANAGFLVGAAASGAYLGLEAQLKHHRTATLFKRLPSLAQTDLVARRAIAFAFPGYSAGLLLGILRAVETDVSAWWADPRIMLAGIVWAVYAVYLFLHYARNVSGRTAARIALVGAVFVVAVFIVARTVPAGFHVFAVPGA
jgi:ABC-type transport system involved in cytochrome c biogenesis permease subunit